MESNTRRFMGKRIEKVDTVIEVWAENLAYEINRKNSKLSSHPMIALDSEFPGFLRNRPMLDPENLKYKDLVFNVNSLKLIQIGLTLFNEKGEIGGCWQINFSGFNINCDTYVPESIQLLKGKGIDFEKNRLGGVNPDNFSEKFNMILSRHREYIRWVMFHGIYDVAYLTKLLTKKDIPGSKSEFVNMVVNAMGGVFYDVKLIADQSWHLGLQKISEELGMEKLGKAHQAGSDSLLTAKVFLKLTIGGNKIDLINYKNYLFGFNDEICNRSEMSRVQLGRDEIENNAIELLQGIYGDNYPVCVVPPQVYDSQGYYVTRPNFYPFAPTGPCYLVPACRFYHIFLTISGFCLFSYF